MQEERLPRIRMRARVWRMKGRQEVTDQDMLGKCRRRGQARLGVGMMLALTACGRRGFHMVLPCCHLSILPREVFEPTVERGELVVRYRVRKSYSRRTTEATCK